MTREEYMNRSLEACNSVEESERVHAEYYAQFVTDEIKRHVLATAGADALLASRMKYFNDLPLGRFRVPQSEIRQLKIALKERGDFLSVMADTCVAKEAARQIVSELRTRQAAEVDA